MEKTSTMKVSTVAPYVVSAYSAQQKVNNFVLNEISYMMYAGEPGLYVNGGTSWRVPIHLSLTSKGDVGTVGHIDVDVNTGQMHLSPQQLVDIESRAEHLADTAASNTTK